MKAKKNPNRIGRKRRLTGWTLITLGVVVAGVWLASGWWLIYGRIGTLYFEHVRGNLYFLADSPGGPAFNFVKEAPNERKGRFSWWFGTGSDVQDDFDRHYHYGLVSLRLLSPGPERWTLRTAYWPIPLLLWLTAAPILRSGIIARRRATKGSCARCGYSLTGLASEARCPECGKGAVAG